MASKVEETVWAIAEPIANENGVEIYDVEFKKEGPDYFLRVFIDKSDGGLIALTRFQGEIGFYPEEYLEIIRTYLGK